MKKIPYQLSLIVLAGALLLGACSKKVVKKAALDEDTHAEDSVSSEELDIHGKDFVSSPNVKTILFDYDSEQLSDAARQILGQNAEYLKNHSDVEVLVSGHCDDRGTIAYNLALGQKRAQVVRKYYIALGISSKRIGTLSYGKEKPECVDMTDECRAKNRRAETKIRIFKSVQDSTSSQKNEGSDSRNQ